MKSLSHVQLLATPWAAVYLGPPHMGFARPEYWSGVPLPSPRISEIEDRMVEINESERKKEKRIKRN